MSYGLTRLGLSPHMVWHDTHRCTRRVILYTTQGTTTKQYTGPRDTMTPSIGGRLLVEPGFERSWSAYDGAAILQPRGRLKASDWNGQWHLHGTKGIVGFTAFALSCR
jgi:hypothetical protein